MSEVAKNAKKRNYYKQPAHQELRFIDALQGIFLTSGINDNFKISKSAFFMLRRHTNALPEIVPKLRPEEQQDIRLADEKVSAQGQEALEIGGFDLLDGEDEHAQAAKEDAPAATTEQQPNEAKEAPQSELRFSKLLPGAKGCMFISIPRTEEPIVKVYRDLVKARQEGTHFENVAKFWPVQFTCKAEKDDLLQTFHRFAGKTIACEEELQDRVWEIKVRNNEGVKDETVAEWLAALGLRQKVVHWTEEKNPDLRRLYVNVCRCNLMFGYD